MSEKNDLTIAIAEDFSGELEPIESGVKFPLKYF